MLSILSDNQIIKNSFFKKGSNMSFNKTEAKTILKKNKSGLTLVKPKPRASKLSI